MATFKIIVAYDGTGFVGWQRQATGTSIQGLLEDALRELDERDVTVVGAGRTDAGVHALGQVASFSLNRLVAADVLVRAVNARLPEQVRVIAANEVPPSFHARFDARAKTYRYCMWNDDVLSPFDRTYAWHLPEPLAVDAMQAAAQRLEGRHDFVAFQSSGSEPETTERVVFSSRVYCVYCGPADGGPASLRARRAFRLRAEALRRREGPHDNRRSDDSRGAGLQAWRVTYEITGNGFLRHMVRTIVGSLVEIGRERRDVEWMSAILASRDRAQAGPTAPAHGLFLMRVDYDRPYADLG